MRKFKRDDLDGCWNWIGSGGSGGYGSFCAKEFGGGVPAHRLSYRLTFGEIDSAAHVHHICRNKLCVNPDHLEVVAASEHKALEDIRTCRRGHEYTEENTHVDAKGYRHCRICSNAAAKRSRAKCVGVLIPSTPKNICADPLNNVIGLPVGMLRRFVMICPSLVLSWLTECRTSYLSVLSQMECRFITSVVTRSV
jgi:hypothetical protein